jgi:tRNA threonylcarbamoyladenosine biosynthesis protein TsaB
VDRLRILALDTTTAWGSVALVEGGEVRGEARLRAPSGHSHSTMPAVAFVLRALGLAPGEWEGLAVTSGPGSFTGLRIGIGTVQGLGLASGRPCLGLSSLDILAARMRGAAACLVSMVDAHRGEVYAGLYDAEAHPTGPWRLQTPAALLDEVPDGSAFLGDGALRYRDEILRLRPGAVFPQRSLYLAGTLGLIAEPRLRAGEGGDAAELRPVYLRSPAFRRSSG